jgi:hypothetical protein
VRGFAWPDANIDKLNMKSIKAAYFIRLNDAECRNGVGLRELGLHNQRKKSGEISPLSIDLTNEDEILINPLFFVI